MSDHARRMDAKNYWRQFPISVRFLEPCEITGRLIELGEIRVRGEILPRLRIQQKDGTVLVIVVGQAVLLAELARTLPAVGDLLKITYLGEAKTSAPGMNPTKEFTVEVRTPPPAGTDPARGSAGPENAPAAGKQP